MSEAVALRDGPGTAPEVHLAECWADFSKALSIYPETNARVTSALDALLDSLRAALARSRARPGANPEAGIVLCFREGVVLAGEEAHAFTPSSSLEWLRQRLDRAGLAGLEFLADADARGLVAFSRRLFENFTRKGHAPQFEELWPDGYPGLVLIDRRFEGHFGGDAADGVATSGHADLGAGGDGRAFVHALLSHPRISTRLHRLQEVAGTGEDDEEAGRASDLLHRVLDDLPAEALRSRDALLDAICRVVDGLIGQAERDVGDDDELAQRERLAGLLQRVSQQHFSRQGPVTERLAADKVVVVGPSGGRARDDAIGDDVAALLDEVGRLPCGGPVRLSESGDVETTEQLCTLLHFLVHLERPEELRGLHSLLDRMLEPGGELQVAALRAWLADGDADEQERRRAAITTFLVRVGKAVLLRASGVLTRERVLASFPEGFALWLETLDPLRPAEAAELDEVCALLGPDRLLDASARLAPGLARLPGRQARALFGRPSAARLPLVRLVLEHHPESLALEASVFLRTLDLPQPEAFLLFHVEDTSLLTPGFLQGLVDRHLGRITSQDLRRHASDVLCRHIEALGEEDPRHAARLESIRHLARFPSARAWKLLQDLRQSGFLGGLGAKEPASVRRLARSVAQAYEAA